jgi:hypothetical protein
MTSVYTPPLPRSSACVACCLLDTEQGDKSEQSNVEAAKLLKLRRRRVGLVVIVVRVTPFLQKLDVLNQGEQRHDRYCQVEHHMPARMYALTLSLAVALAVVEDIHHHNLEGGPDDRQLRLVLSVLATLEFRRPTHCSKGERVREYRRQGVPKC